VDAAWIVLRVLERLITFGELQSPVLAKAIKTYRIDVGDGASLNNRKEPDR
jgi:pyruvate dehydrogenase complex dehydrogenase (E1) component